MKESFWDEVALRYDEEIFNTLTSDKHRRLVETVRKYATDVPLACDFGCGVGRFLPLLAACAQQVIATDFSARSLRLARQAVPPDSIEFHKLNLATRRQRFAQADLGLLVNVMIMPNRQHRTTLLENVRRNLASRGRLIVVVPSYEAAIYSYQRLFEWYLRDGSRPASILRKLDRTAHESTSSLVDGIFDIQGTATKHYLREELFVLFQRHRFAVLEESRVEYDWQEEYEQPPSWMKEPWPWEWLFVVQKS